MQILTVGTGSKGNCYVVEMDGESLIIECGSSLFAKLRKSLDYDFSKVKGALISHSHKDHCGDIKYLLQLGIHVASSEATFKGLDKYSGYIHIIKHQKGLKFGDFSVVCVKMVHDVECYGFYIKKGSETLFFATDTTDIPYVLPQVDVMMIEANYSQKIIEQRLYDCDIVRSLYDRIRRSHFSIDKAEVVIMQQKRLKAAVLIHLSADNANADEFKHRIEHLGIITEVAKNGEILQFI